jgi:hypothetical protein
VSREERLRDARAAIREWSGGTGGDVCGPCLQVLDVTGVSVSMLTGTMTQATLGATDAVAAPIEELQLVLGEGPCWEAMDSPAPVLVPDVRRVEGRPWPLFAAAARDIPAGGSSRSPFGSGR